MPTFLNKTLLVILLCLIFIGQSVASMTMFYGMTSMQSMSAMSGMSSMSNSHHDMSKMDTATHHMTAMTNISACAQEDMTNTCPTTATEECCAQECDCLTSGCSTISAFTAIINYHAEIAIANKIVSSSAFIASNTLTSLYRPPILS
ncbi:hypothetical protein [Colwellia sp. TT2012]|uniref:hypothetical protein n=1 Tax=Colwellia sp. TT2012 TaxID=1720342 RepID=UPI00070F28A5|nr:hypothetical protein [Colwellia sp. TT2012]